MENTSSSLSNLLNSAIRNGEPQNQISQQQQISHQQHHFPPTQYPMNYPPPQYPPNFNPQYPHLYWNQEDRRTFREVEQMAINIHTLLLHAIIRFPLFFLGELISSFIFNALLVWRLRPIRHGKQKEVQSLTW